MKREIKLLVAVITALLVAYTVFFFMRVGKVKVEIILAPSDSVIEIDGKTYSTGVHYFESGTYNIRAYRDDFYERAFSYEVRDGIDNTLAVGLEPSTEQGRQIQQNSLQEYQAVEAAAGQQAQIEGERFREENPLVNALPYRGDGVWLDYRLNKENKNKIVVQATVANYSSSNEVNHESVTRIAITQLGYDFDDYEIEYMPSHIIDLPTTKQNFTIEYDDDSKITHITQHPTPNNTFILNYKPSDSDYRKAREEALAYIRDVGYDPNLLTIQYSRL